MRRGGCIESQSLCQGQRSLSDRTVRMDREGSIGCIDPGETVKRSNKCNIYGDAEDPMDIFYC